GRQICAAWDLPAGLPAVSVLGLPGPPSTIVMAGDFSGLEVALEAAVNVATSCGLRVEHAWSSDTNSACRSFLRANRPGRILKSVTDPVSNLAELRVSMYVAGFP
ncbi:unnamed protein product, partial [Effrenium voratum]